MVIESMAGRFRAAALSCVLASAVLGASTPTAVSLRISSEVVPPGGVAQIKVFVTEPKPISTGSMRVSFAGFDSFAGIAAISPANDTYVVADIRGSQIRFAIVSPTATFGTDPDGPILTVTARVPATTSIGGVMPVSFGGGGIRLLDPTGSVYPTELQDGSVTAGGGISIEDVSPGSADLRTGSSVNIVGRGFMPATRIRFHEVNLSSVQYLDDRHIRVELEEPARMHGIRIRAENRDTPRTTYYSYQRTYRQGTSVFPAFQSAVPLFPMRLFTNAGVSIPGVSTALALQNTGEAIAPVAVELLAPGGQVLATTITSVAPNRFTVADVSELFGIAYVASSSVRVRSAVPIQVMGIQINASGDATPIAPQ